MKFKTFVVFAAVLLITAAASDAFAFGGLFGRCCGQRASFCKRVCYQSARGSCTYGQPAATCSGGSCTYSQPAATCSGGSCTYRQPAPTCSGGSCTYRQPAPTCSGGSCTYGQPAATCSGGSCTYGQPAPTCSGGSCTYSQPAATCSGGSCTYSQPAATCSGGSCSLLDGVKGALQAVVENIYLARVNAVRARYGLRALALDSSLDSQCAAHCQNMAVAGYIFHAPGCGFEIVAANSGAGIDGALDQWQNSPAHAAILLNPNLTRCGVQTFRDAYGRNYCAARFR